MRVTEPYPYNVLFLCTGNSVRSIMAEAILNRAGAPKFKAYSAGSHPKGAVHPLVLTFLKARGFETRDLRSKSWDEYAAPNAPRLDFVFTICGNAANEVCPLWRGGPVAAHWGVPDPASAGASQEEIAKALAGTYDRLEQRIAQFCLLPLGALDHAALAQCVATIGGQAADAVAQ